MRQILTDFALYDAGPTRWKVPNFTGLPTICSNVSPSLRYANLDIRTPGMVWVYGSWLPGPVYGLLRLQSDWMDGVAWGQFAEMTSAAQGAAGGFPVPILCAGNAHKSLQMSFNDIDSSQPHAAT